jgi:phosphohistidine phosphatase
MRLLIIRHALAVERGTPDIADDDRPLTPEGERKFKKAARGLARVATRPEAILSSPLPRAWRTAEIAAAAWGRLAPERTPALVGGSLGDLAHALGPYGAQSTVAIVGHEPHLSGLLAELLGSRTAERLTFRKGGAALVDVPADLASGGNLVWFLPPKLLRALGE